MIPSQLAQSVNISAAGAPRSTASATAVGRVGLATAAGVDAGKIVSMENAPHSGASPVATPTMQARALPEPLASSAAPAATVRDQALAEGPQPTRTLFDVMKPLIEDNEKIVLRRTVNDFALVGESMRTNVCQVSRRVNSFEFTPLHLVIMRTVEDVGFCSDRVKELIDLGADVNLMSTYDWSSIGGHKRIPPLKLAEKLLAKLEQDEDAESWVIDDMKDVIEHLKRAGATTEGAALRTCDSDDEGKSDWDSEVDEVPGRDDSDW